MGDTENNIEEKILSDQRWIALKDEIAEIRRLCEQNHDALAAIAKALKVQIPKRKG